MDSTYYIIRCFESDLYLCGRSRHRGKDRVTGVVAARERAFSFPRYKDAIAAVKDDNGVLVKQFGKMVILKITEEQEEMNTPDTTEFEWNSEECRPRTIKEKLVFILLRSGFTRASHTKDSYIRTSPCCQVTFGKRSFEIHRRGSGKSLIDRRKINCTTLENFHCYL